MKYGNHSLSKSITRSPITLIVLLIVFAFLARATWGVYGKSTASRDRLAQAQAALDAVKDHEADLTTKVGYLSTDQGVESEIRTKFRAVGNGESVAVIVGDPAKEAVVASSTVPKLSWWQSLLSFVGLW